MTVPFNPTPESAGCRFVKHETKGAAKVQMSRLIRLGRAEVPGKPGKELNVYRCPACGYWHVGHRASYAARAGGEKP